MYSQESKIIYGWGMNTQTTATVFSADTQEDIPLVLGKVQKIIPRGNGLSYGDASLQKTVFNTLHLNRIISFDIQFGIIQVQSGVTLTNLLAHIVPAGFILPVIPGTKYVTVGGAIAANIHGKNHPSQGSFSKWVLAMEILLANGDIVACSPDRNRELYVNTCGGMGLTGIILNATLHLVNISTAYLLQSQLVIRSWHQLYEGLLANTDYPYKVAWLDLLNRRKDGAIHSVLSRGRPVGYDQLQKAYRSQPLFYREIIKISSGGFSVDLMHTSIQSWLHQAKLWSARYNQGEKIVHLNDFFFPLDQIPFWNRCFGKAGLYQYQCVLPLKTSYHGFAQIFALIKSAGVPVFLATMKLFGPTTSASPLSFPMEGFTLALDFKASPSALNLMTALDQIVLAGQGRVYLAKDARLSPEVFRKMYPDAVADRTLFRSLLAERLNL